MNGLQITSVKNLKIFLGEKINYNSKVSIIIKKEQYNDIIKCNNDNTFICLIKLNNYNSIMNCLNKISYLCDTFNLKIDSVESFKILNKIYRSISNKILQLDITLNIQVNYIRTTNKFVLYDDCGSYSNEQKHAKCHYLPNSIIKLNLHHIVIDCSFLNNKLKQLEFNRNNSANAIINTTKKIPHSLKYLRVNTLKFKANNGKLFDENNNVVNNHPINNHPINNNFSLNMNDVLIFNGNQHLYKHTNYA
jgi:hypothetical protein